MSLRRLLPQSLLSLVGSLALLGCERGRFDKAMPPVAVADLKPILDADLATSLTKGPLAPGTHGGVTVGVVQHGVRRIYSYGTAQPDSLFEIGSITKTFTGLMLAQLVEQGQVRLDQPIRELLPTGTTTKPVSGPEITLLDLSSQHSGLPRMPDNIHPANRANPFAGYGAVALYAYMAKQGVGRAADAPFYYSNVSMGLLGQTLAAHTGVSYATLLHDQITAPLGMTDTSIELTPALTARLIQGYTIEGNPAPPWDFDALAGCGAIRSTAADILTYLEAQLHPAATLSTPQGKTLPAAIALTHIPRAEAGPGNHIGLNWMIEDAAGTYSHEGGTGGYSAYALFNPQQDFAVVVLYNRARSEPAFPDTLAQHIAQRLTGKPALKLPMRLTLRELLRDYYRRL